MNCSGIRVVDPRIGGTGPLSMADGTSSMEVRRELDGLKDQLQVNSNETKKLIEELREMIASVAASVPELHGRPASETSHGGGVGIDPDFLEVDGTPPEAKVRIAAVHLEGKALQWHQISMKNRLTRDLPHWSEYVTALNDRFDALLYEDPMSELVNLKQTNTIQAYFDKFDEIMNCVELPEQYAISCFLGGLRSDIAIPVRMFKPRTLQNAISLAKLQEHANSMTAKKPNPPLMNRYTPNINKSNFPNPSPRPTHSPYSSPLPSAQPHIPNKPNFTTQRSSAPPIIPSRRLSPQEMDEKRAKNICFWCDEKFTPGHQCSKRRQLYIMETNEEEADKGKGEPIEELSEGQRYQ
ncbi:hypothetical protein BUALT_Bualt05G0118400 [Buddleja alternifolia]|uniref:Retrotransposon gag domain-containing protein n=1 Tax=Buddleja alternifolia TaxID=168488 RepID=A0AAV6XUM6_9LAMI|nr:hypothetical protein BUALT_Bualt05G0118400 [Buddleja alternifolia]